MLPVPLLNFRRAPVTLILLAVMVSLEVVCSLEPGRRDYYYNDLQLGIWWQIWDGQIWRPLTTTLLHGNLIHMIFNAYWLATFGPVLEDRIKPVRMLIVVVLLAYVSSLLQYVIWGFFKPVAEQSGGVGFSGVIYGLAGVLWIGRRRHPEFELVCNRAVMQFFVFWFLLCILLSASGLWPIANIAHGSGLVFGLLYGRALFDAKWRPHWIAVAIGASALVLSTMIACPRNKAYEHVQRLRKAGMIQRTPSDQENGTRVCGAPPISPHPTSRGESRRFADPSLDRLPVYQRRGLAPAKRHLTGVGEVNTRPVAAPITRSPNGESGRGATRRSGAARRGFPRSGA